MELWEFTGNVALALLLGTLIGVERQWSQHPAGVRTNALVSVGAALFVSLTPLLGETSSPSRIASYVVSGVGFLGGGVILKASGNIHGITTAAALWCSAAVGTLAGSGFGLHAAVGTAAILFVVVGLRPLSHGIDALRRRGEAAAYRVRVSCDSKTHAAVRTALARHAADHAGLALTGITASKKKRRRVFLLAEIHAERADDAAVQEIVNRLLTETGVNAASWEKLPPTAE